MSWKPKLAENVLQDEAGCQYHRALVIEEARDKAETAYEEFRHDDSFPADLLAALVVIKDAEVKV